MKRVLYTVLSVLVIGGLLVWAKIESSITIALAAFIPFAFVVGFLLAIQRTYKMATGEVLTDEKLTEVLERLL